MPSRDINCGCIRKNVYRVGLMKLSNKNDMEGAKIHKHNACKNLLAISTYIIHKRPHFSNTTHIYHLRLGNYRYRSMISLLSTYK